MPSQRSSIRVEANKVIFRASILAFLRSFFTGYFPALDLELWSKGFSKNIRLWEWKLSEDGVHTGAEDHPRAFMQDTTLKKSIGVIFSLQQWKGQGFFVNSNCRSKSKPTDTLYIKQPYSPGGPFAASYTWSVVFSGITLADQNLYQIWKYRSDLWNIRSVHNLSCISHNHTCTCLYRVYNCPLNHNKVKILSIYLYLLSLSFPAIISCTFHLICKFQQKKQKK